MQNWHPMWDTQVRLEPSRHACIQGAQLGAHAYTPMYRDQTHQMQRNIIFEAFPLWIRTNGNLAVVYWLRRSIVIRRCQASPRERGGPLDRSREPSGEVWGIALGRHVCRTKLPPKNFKSIRKTVWKTRKSKARKPWSTIRELRGWRRRGCREGCQEQPEKGA